MPTVLIAGGTGLVGTRLSQLLTQKGYEVAILSRSKSKDSPYQVYQWNLKKEWIEEEAVESADYIINLAGAGIADALWTKSRKQLIINSRLDTTHLLQKAIVQAQTPPKAYISASAIGYYGNRGNELVTENSPAGKSGFLSKTTILWEEAIKEVERTGVRTAALRIGIVLSTQGGAMEKMLLPFKMRVGNYFGDGSQWYSWIHLDDLCRMFIYAIENERIKGFYNAVAPNPATNKDFTYQLKDALNQFSLVVAAPEFALKMAMGEMSSVVLNSTKVASDKIEAAGFEFKYPKLLPALKHLVKEEI